MTENADDSARLATLLANTRTLLANTRTLLAYIRTALAFAGLGFAVAKFGLNPKTHAAGYLGTFMVLVGLVVAVIGFAQHRIVMREGGAGLQGTCARAGAAHRGGRGLRPGLRAAGQLPRGHRHLSGYRPDLPRGR